MKRVLLILSAGFEELEVVAPLDLLRRAGIMVVSASPGDLLVEGSHGIRIQADRKLDECLSEDFDMVVLPGGPGVDGLRKDPRVLELVRRTHAQAVPGEPPRLAAICAAPLILADAGILGNRKVTSFPGTRAELEGRVKEYSVARIVEDGPIVTSRGAGTAEEFALKLVEILMGRAAAEDVRARIVAR